MKNTQKLNPKAPNHAFQEHNQVQGKNLKEFISKSQLPQK